MVTLAEKALAVVLGIETVAGKGPTGRAGRAALKAGARAIIAGTTVIAPPVARAVTRTAVANPLLAAGVLGTAAYQAGYLDPAIQRAQEESFRAQENLRQTLLMQPMSDIQRTYEMAGSPDLREVVPKVAKRKLSKFNKAMKAGMSAVRKSKSNGKPGKLMNARATFGRVAKVYKSLSSGRKVSSKGETGVIKRNIKRYIG